MLADDAVDDRWVGEHIVAGQTHDGVRLELIDDGQETAEHVIKASAPHNHARGLCDSDEGIIARIGRGRENQTVEGSSAGDAFDRPEDQWDAEHRREDLSRKPRGAHPGLENREGHEKRLPAKRPYAETVVTVRRAKAGDSRDLLAWRNDPETRAASIDTGPVPLATHEAWFTRVLADPHRVLYIGLDEAGTSIGMVRFDRGDDGAAEVSINVAPAQRGRRLGRALLLAAISSYRGEAGNGTLYASVRTGNAASLRLFRRVGFSTAGGSSDVIVLVLRDDRRISRAGPS
ncbi:hypothetical protein GCM10009739_13520 [Microbacterium ulmi]